MELLEEAAAIEDGMAYQEPPRLYQPIRHCLGYVQLNFADNFTAAERVRPWHAWAHPSLCHALSYKAM